MKIRVNRLEQGAIPIMKVFVTGANGFLGSHLVDRLLERRDEVHLLVRKSSNLRWLLGKKVHYHYGDVAGSDLKGLRNGIEGSDVVYHVAGIIRARRARTYYEVNAQGTANLLDACLKGGTSRLKRVVVVTSLAAHGPGSDDRPMSEEEECHPLTDYGKSKREAELIALRYADRLPIAIVRPPAIYGPRDENIVHFFRMVRKGIVFLAGSGKGILNLAHVQDVVTGILLAAENPKAVGEIFFVGEDRNYDWMEAVDIFGRVVRRGRLLRIHIPTPLVLGVGAVADVIGLVIGRPLPFGLAYARNFIQKNWAIDVSKAKKVLEFQSQYSLARGVRETLDWYEREGWIKNNKNN